MDPSSMVDPTALSQLGIATLQTIFAKALEKRTEKGVDKALDAALAEADDASRSIYQWLRSKFGHREELKSLQDTPDSKMRAKMLSDVVEAELVDDSTAASELAALLDSLRQQQPHLFQTVSGNANVLVSGNSNTIHYQTAPEPGPPKARWEAVATGRENVEEIRYVGGGTVYDIRLQANGGQIMERDLPTVLQHNDVLIFTYFQPWGSGDNTVDLWYADSPGGEPQRERLIMI